MNEHSRNNTVPYYQLNSQISWQLKNPLLYQLNVLATMYWVQINCVSALITFSIRRRDSKISNKNFGIYETGNIL